MKLKKILKRYQNLQVSSKAMLWYTISNILVKSIALLSTPIFTRLMTPNEFGQFTIFQSWLSISIIFTSLNAFLAGYTKGLLKYKEAMDEFTSASLGFVLSITFFWSVLYLLFRPLWDSIFGMTSNLMVLMLLDLLMMPAYEFWSARQRFDFKYRAVTAASLGISASSILLGIVMVMLGSDKVEMRALSDLIARIIIGGIMLYTIFSKGHSFYNRKIWVYNFKFNFPLLPHYLSFYVLNQADRVMISKMIGNTEAAFYSVAYTISMMMNLVMTALNNALTPYIYKNIDSGKIKEIKKTTSPLFITMMVLCILSMMFAPEIIQIFAGAKYMDAIYVIPPVAASVFFVFVYAMYSTIEYFYQKNGRIAAATFLSAILNILLNLVFLKKWGYYAAGYTTLCSYMFLAIVHYIFYRLILVDKLDKNDRIFDDKTIVICSIITLFTMILVLIIYRHAILRYTLLVGTFVVFAFNYKKIRAIISKVRSGD